MWRLCFISCCLKLHPPLAEDETQGRGLDSFRPHHVHDSTLAVVCAIDIGCLVFISNLHDIPPVFIYLSRSANLLTCCSSVFCDRYNLPQLFGFYLSRLFYIIRTQKLCKLILNFYFISFCITFYKFLFAAYILHLDHLKGSTSVR